MKINIITIVLLALLIGIPLSTIIYNHHSKIIRELYIGICLKYGICLNESNAITLMRLVGNENCLS